MTIEEIINNFKIYGIQQRLIQLLQIKADATKEQFITGILQFIIGLCFKTTQNSICYHYYVANNPIRGDLRRVVFKANPP